MRRPCWTKHYTCGDLITGLFLMWHPLAASPAESDWIMYYIQHTSYTLTNITCSWDSMTGGGLFIACLLVDASESDWKMHYSHCTMHILNIHHLFIGRWRPFLGLSPSMASCPTSRKWLKNGNALYSQCTGHADFSYTYLSKSDNWFLFGVGPMSREWLKNAL